MEPEHARMALARWDDFPVDRDPRPIVLTAATPQWHDRVAAELRTSAFDGPAVPERELTPEQLRLALDYCRDVNTGEPGPLGRIVQAPVPFTTDRGERLLPAWFMLPDNRRWPLVMLDREFERSSIWHPPGQGAPQSTEVSSLAPDGHTLTYRFLGQPCGVADYPTAVVTESETAVHVEAIERWLAPPDSVWPAVVEEHSLVVRLAAPLGNRVLIDLGAGADTLGSPRTVILAATASVA